MLDLLSEAASAELMRLSRAIPEQPATPAELDTELAGIGGDLPLVEEIEAFTRDLYNLELALDTWQELLTEPQGRSFDPIAEGYRQLAQLLPDRREIEFIFKPVPPLEYKIYTDVLPRFRSVRLGLNRDVFATLPRLMLADYPAAFEHDAFQHAAIAHELGHVALEYFEDNPVPAGDAADPADAKAGTEAEQPVGIWDWALREAEIDDERRSEFDEDQELFIELACDHLGVCLLGPASALAFVEYTLARNIYKRPSYSETHPELPWRLAELKTSVADYFAGADDEPFRSARQVVDGALTIVEPKRPDNRPLVMSALTRLRALTDAVIDQARYKPALFRQELPIVWSKRGKRIAPAEAIFERDVPRPTGETGWSRPLDWRSILNGGYLYYLVENARSGPPQHWREAEDGEARRAAANELVRGSIELRHLHRAMLDQREQLIGLETKSDDA